MTGCSFTDTHDGITSWGWRGDRRLWRVRRHDQEGPIDYLSYEYDPCEALMEFLGRVETYEVGWSAFSFD
jgi:hypothetical protein